ncbi:MAG: hypothetical protein PHU98_06300 [Mariniphaga sp.]|nr:hypothetical protein [Paludibacter sp.]MDD4225982.1 hypothetical protein [Mariniphaga sp.]
MKADDIKNTAFYKSLSELSNSERGIMFEKHDTEIEKILSVKLVKHSYTELGKIKTNNPMISYQENWGSFTGSLIALMEFVPQ